MAIYEIGRVCRKTAGAEAGKLCVILTKPTEGMVTIAGPNIKKSKTSMAHLEPLPNTVQIAKDAGQIEAVEALKKEGLIL
ncbi:MAG: 50S ribosomal protein L14e [Candidatus Altiarchaeota archaeon]|nr:50S ribosomal protein L14e [Candidatus Altiarchaeota archaeon]